MNVLSQRKTRLIVEFSDTVRERGKVRPVTMEFTPYGISVRLKGMRQRYEISPARVYNQAAILEVERRRAERKAARKEKSHGR